MPSQDYRCSKCGERYITVEYPDGELIDQCPEGH
jgi:DNA-directed RNA polymerase subunit RPC12/RpoP